MPKMSLFEPFSGQKTTKMTAKIWQRKANSSRKQQNRRFCVELAMLIASLFLHSQKTKMRTPLRTFCKILRSLLRSFEKVCTFALSKI